MYGTIVELLIIAFLNANHMNGASVIPNIGAVSTLFRTAERLEKPRGNLNVFSNDFKGVILSDLKRRKGSLII